MVLAANKCSIITLFSDPTDIFSHQVRIVLAEKRVNVEIETVKRDQPPPKDLIELNPYVSVPTLVDRDLTLYKSRIIIEYLDERFPHPPLMSVYPMARGKARLIMHRIRNDWYSLLDKIQQGSDSQVASARQQLKEELLAIAPIFRNQTYFMSDDFSLIDCYLAPLLWRLPELNIKLEKDTPGFKELDSYMTRVFRRESFIGSLTAAEREMNPSYQSNNYGSFNYDSSSSLPVTRFL